MADIHVEPKKQTTGTMWIWVVVVLVLAALVYFLAIRNRAADTTTPPVNTTGAMVLPTPSFQPGCVVLKDLYPVHRYSTIVFVNRKQSFHKKTFRNG